MNIPWKTTIWSQFGAAIDTLDDMLRACPDNVWRERLWDNRLTRPEYAEFWYRVYHALFWLDLYLTGAEEGFVPPAPFELIEMEEDDLPSRVYTKDELQAYLEYGRKKCQATIEALTEEAAQRRCQFCGITALQYAACSGDCGTVEPFSRTKRSFGFRLCSHS